MVVQAPSTNKTSYYIKMMSLLFLWSPPDLFLHMNDFFLHLVWCHFLPAWHHRSSCDLFPPLARKALVCQLGCPTWSRTVRQDRDEQLASYLWPWTRKQKHPFLAIMRMDKVAFRICVGTLEIAEEQQSFSSNLFSLFLYPYMFSLLP